MQIALLGVVLKHSRESIIILSRVHAYKSSMGRLKYGKVLMEVVFQRSL